MALKRAVISISGLVQGIGFRPFVYRLAVKRGLRGYVKNLGDAGVDIDVNGKKDDILAFIKDLKEKKLPIAIYTKIEVKWLDYNEEYTDFTIDNSDLGKRDVKLSIIPPDITICQECLEELFDQKDRHYHYPFTCCAICGPRFTTIVDIPYDRERTTMTDFPLCPNCGNEFYDPINRRFNAQTICCPDCGPKMTLYRIDGTRMDGKTPIKTAAELLEEGSIIVIKGIGGTHLAVKTSDDEPVLRLRARRRKPEKPFAIMSSSLKDVEGYAFVSDVERELLTSYTRPIVALRKHVPFPLSEYVSPGLHTVGVMLPYSGIHHLLFRYLEEPALVMTSANFPGEPMTITNEGAFKQLGEIADYLLLHDREIHARCDDSVIRLVDGNPIFIRRSRGYVPMPLTLPFFSEKTIAAVGPEESSTASFLKGNKCYLSQHLGDIESPDSVSFLRESLKHLTNLVRGGRLDAVACDLHPRFLSRDVALELVEESNGELIEVQHHHAHLASLIADNGIESDSEIVCITCDGYGYGVDGTPWGGEILVGGYEAFRRAGHLEPQAMPGGDLCALRYGRMLQGILYSVLKKEELREILVQNYLDGFSFGEREVDVVFTQLERGIYTPYTTSAGRLLDAVSCLLGVSYRRTYEGEGAMKLESTASLGAQNQVDLTVEIEKRNGVHIINTSNNVKKLFELQNVHKKEDLAYGFHKILGEGLAKLALKVAKEHGIDKIGFSGGVAYNDIITRYVRKNVDRSGYEFLYHRNVPCGDGGVSLGQAAVASFKAS